MAQFFPGQGPAVDDDIERRALVPALAPHQAAGHLVSGYEPPRPVRIGLQVAEGHLGLGVGPVCAEQLAHLGVVGAEDGELEAPPGTNAGLLQLDHDAGRCPPRAGLHAVRRPSGPASTNAAGGGPSSGRPVSVATRRSAQPSHNGVPLKWTRTSPAPQSSQVSLPTVGTLRVRGRSWDLLGAKVTPLAERGHPRRGVPFTCRPIQGLAMEEAP